MNYRLVFGHFSKTDTLKKKTFTQSSTTDDGAVLRITHSLTNPNGGFVSQSCPEDSLFFSLVLRVLLAPHLPPWQLFFQNSHHMVHLKTGFQELQEELSDQGRTRRIRTAQSWFSPFFFFHPGGDPDPKTALDVRINAKRLFAVPTVAYQHRYMFNFDADHC